MPLTTIAVLLLTDPTGGTGEATRAAAPVVELNPFGTALTMVAWLSLIAINLWCFRRILRQGRSSGENH